MVTLKLNLFNFFDSSQDCKSVLECLPVPQLCQSPPMRADWETWGNIIWTDKNPLLWQQCTSHNEKYSNQGLPRALKVIFFTWFLFTLLYSKIRVFQCFPGAFYDHLNRTISRLIEYWYKILCPWLENKYTFQCISYNFPGMLTCNFGWTFQCIGALQAMRQATNYCWYFM